MYLNQQKIRIVEIHTFEFKTSNFGQKFQYFEQSQKIFVDKSQACALFSPILGNSTSKW